VVGGVFFFGVFLLGLLLGVFVCSLWGFGGGGGGFGVGGVFCFLGWVVGWSCFFFLFCGGGGVCRAMGQRSESIIVAVRHGKR